MDKNKIFAIICYKININMILKYVKNLVKKQKVYRPQERSLDLFH